MASGSRTITITIAGDSKGAQKAFNDTSASAGQMQAKVEGVGETFTNAFAKIGLGAIGIGSLVGLFKEAASATEDYNNKVNAAETQIRALTQSNEAVAKAQALANQEVKAGRAAYSDVMQAIATLTPVAKRSGADITDLYRTVQLLATLNSGPEGGVEGAVIAISEALAGQWTSAVRRFNLPKQEIDKLKNEGVPALQIFNQIIAQSGVTLDSMTQAAQRAGNQQAILKDNIMRLATEANQPIFEALNRGIAGANKEFSSDALPHWTQEYQTLVGGLIASLTSWQALAATVGNLGLIGERNTEAWLESWLKLSEAIAGQGGKVLGKLLGFTDEETNALIAKGNAQNPLQKIIDGWKSSINQQQADIDARLKQYVTQPAANQVSGSAPGSPVSPDKMAGYSSDLLAAYLSTFQSPQLDALDQFKSLVADKFKDSPEQLQQATTLFATAIDEINQYGQLSDGTFGASEGNLGKYISTAGQATNTTADLTAAFGDQAPQVLQLLEDYRQTTIAQTNLAIATGTTADAQQHLKDVQAAATSDLAGYQQAVDDATAAEKRHQESSQALVDAKQDEIAAAQEAADTQSRATQAELDGLNAQLAAIQQVQQAHQSGAQARAGLEAAILAGQKDEYLRQLDLVDAEKQQTQAIADKWDAEIGGARRAKSENDANVLKLQREERAKVLQYNKDIDKAQENNNGAEVKRLTKVRDEYTKVQGHKIDLAQQEADVANDNFDIKKEHLDKENKGITENDNAQAKADKAAIDAQQQQITGVQDRQKAEQQAAQERQRALQAELTAIQKNAREQSRADDDALTAARDRYTERQKYWQQETTNAQQAVTDAQAVETAMKNTADAAQKLFDLEVKRFKLYADNGVQPGQPPAAPTLPPLTPNTGQPQGPGGEPGAPQYQQPAAPPPTPAPGPPTAPPPSTTVGPDVIDASQYPMPPEGYHREEDINGHFWYVKDGHSLSEYQQPAAPAPMTSGPTAAEHNLLSPQYAPASASAPAGGDTNQYFTFNFAAGTSASDANHIANTVAATMRRTWQEVSRGGARQTVTTPRTA